MREAMDNAAEQAMRAGQIIRRLRDFVPGRERAADRKHRQARGGSERPRAGRRQEPGIRVAFVLTAPPILSSPTRSKSSRSCSI